MDSHRKRPAKVGRARRSGPGDVGYRESAYQQIKDAILSGTLQPAERITESEVAARLGLSRTPVREAFGLLAAEKLIVIIPQRGSFVSQPTVQDLLEVYQIRVPLECMAVRIAARTISDEELTTLQHLIDGERPQEGVPLARTLASSSRFHEAIVACTRNARLVTLLKQLQGQVHRVRVFWSSTDGLREIWKEHEQLLTALKARDADAAERLMREHLERARANTVNRMMPVS